MKIHALDYPIFIGADVFDDFNQFIKQKKYSKIFALVDENTLAHSLPVIQKNSDILIGCDIIEIKSGEKNKNINTCSTIWEDLTKYGADRNSLLLNIGGGVICDMGGFAASTFKRGIDFINLPTTLLSQVDASIGGKLGIDLQVIKNQIGIFSNPSAVFVSTNFLRSLDKRQMLSGFAEIIKHGLIADVDFWNEIQSVNIMDIGSLDSVISESIKIKKQIVLADPHEKKGLRKSLNFGHTIGHAVESFSLSEDKGMLLHGEAIAIGIICESYLSKICTGLKKDLFKKITKLIKKNFTKCDLSHSDPHFLLDIMKNDKKNSNGKINFTLLEDIGFVKIDQHCTNDQVTESIEYYLNEI